MNQSSEGRHMRDPVGEMRTVGEVWSWDYMAEIEHEQWPGDGVTMSIGQL